MQLASQLTYTKINPPTSPTSKYDIEYFKDNKTLLDFENIKYINTTKTRYTDYFFYYVSDSIIGESLKHYGEYTEHEINLLNLLIQNDYIIYDIGANIGYHTLGLAQKAKHVYAFEPNECNYRLLKLNTAHKSNVTLFDYAISDDIGVTQIERFVPGTVGNYGECRITDNGQLCNMTTIDYLVENDDILPPHLVKIDVEGHEWEVIQGMDETIRNYKPTIFYENMHGDNLGKVWTYLNDLGYEIFYFPCMNYNPNNFKQNNNNVFGNGGVMNALAISPSLEAKTNLFRIISADDTWEQALKRNNVQRN